MATRKNSSGSRRTASKGAAAGGGERAVSLARCVLPPNSRVRIRACDEHTPDWANDIGREFRIGYYNPKDGLATVWLVNDRGEYEQTTDLTTLLRYCTVEHISEEKDLFGRLRPALPLSPEHQTRRMPRRRGTAKSA
jgi:hypothetical protein